MNPHQDPTVDLCVGFDPHPAVFEMWGSSDSVTGLELSAKKFLSLVVEHRVPKTKLQVAFFERYGVDGLKTLARLIGNLRQEGVSVIADTKRGDIESSMRGPENFGDCLTQAREELFF